MKLGGLVTGALLLPWTLRRYDEHNDWKPLAFDAFAILVISTGTKVVDVVKAIVPFAKK